MNIKKIVKPAVSIILVLTLVLSSMIFSFASSNHANDYQETHEQINFNNLDVAIINGDNIQVSVNSSTPFYKKNKAKKEKEKFDEYIAKHPEVEEELVPELESGEDIACISYTEVPLQLVDDHYERIPEESNNSILGLVAHATSSKGNHPSATTNFTLTTSITKGEYNSKKGGYKYTAKTTGTWSSNSIKSGSKYPASGYDYSFQTCPVVISSSFFTSTYNYKTNGSASGQKNVNYWLADGGNGWKEYQITDDPAGSAQLKTFTQTSMFYADSTKKTKAINSYYIHTWKSMKVSVSVSGNCGISGGEPSAGIELSITPSIQEKSWKCYDYVSYNF